MSINTWATCVNGCKYSGVAQSVERKTVNLDVAGPSPATRVNIAGGRHRVLGGFMLHFKIGAIPMLRNLSVSSSTGRTTSF